jgi:hypothetical protein
MLIEVSPHHNWTSSAHSYTELFAGQATLSVAACSMPALWASNTRMECQDPEDIEDSTKDPRRVDHSEDRTT